MRISPRLAHRQSVLARPRNKHRLRPVHLFLHLVQKQNQPANTGPHFSLFLGEMRIFANAALSLYWNFLTIQRQGISQRNAGAFPIREVDGTTTASSGVPTGRGWFVARTRR